MFLFFPQANRTDILCCVKLPDGPQEKSEGCLFRFFKKIYAPFILKDWVRPLVVGVKQQYDIVIYYNVLSYFWFKVYILSVCVLWELNP